MGEVFSKEGRGGGGEALPARGAYKSAGVDVEAGYEAVSRIGALAARTARPGVMGGVGGFGGLFDMGAVPMREPVLVSGADGVGTKLKIAFAVGRHDTIGVDAVAMCVNDIATHGAQPLFFLDYIACGKLDPAKIEGIVKGVSDGCVQAGCALLGGETAEMPGMYPEGEYDIAGFAVGAVEKARLVTGEGVRAGDLIIGLSSSGAHSSGFSLIRKIIADCGLSLGARYGGLGAALGEALLAPTRIYAKAALEIMSKVPVKGMAHITGGGLVENVPRMLPRGLCAALRPGSWEVPEIFGFLQSRGRVAEGEMRGVFNMGIGMALAVAPGDAPEALRAAEAATGAPAFAIGRVAEGEGVSFG